MPTLGLLKVPMRYHANKGLRKCAHRHVETIETKKVCFVRCRDCDAALPVRYHKEPEPTRLAECSHPELKSFTFSDGKTIQFCKHCDVFDAARWSIIGTNPPKYGGEAEYVISDAPSLHASKIEPAVLPIRRGIMRPDGTYGWTKKPFEAPEREKESYDNNPRIVAAYKTHSRRLQNLLRKKVRPHVASDTLAFVTAQELEGDLWAKATAKVSTFREESAFTTWLTTIARHIAEDWIDGQKTQKRDGEELYDFAETENEDGDPEGGYPDAKQDGVYLAKGTFIATEPAIDNLHAMHLHIQRRSIYRKPFVRKYAEPKEPWAPESRELYLELCQQLTQRAAKRHARIPSKALGQSTA
jgi:DNA-directed RNA polymerase specialized sigma24 family protein